MSSGDAPIIPNATLRPTTSRCPRNARSAAAHTWSKKCPKCGSPYLVEKTLKSGVYLECPNKKKSAEEEARAAKRGKKATAAPAEENKVACTYSKRIGDAPPPPTAETHGPVVEKKEEKRELQPA